MVEMDSIVNGIIGVCARDRGVSINRDNITSRKWYSWASRKEVGVDVIITEIIITTEINSIIIEIRILIEINNSRTKNILRNFNSNMAQLDRMEELETEREPIEVKDNIDAINLGLKTPPDY